MNTESLTARQVDIMVEALRRAGFAAWHRSAGFRGESEVWDDDHIHAIAIGDRDLSSEARGQVQDYFNNDDGLIGSATDGDANVGRPVPKWARRFNQ